MASFPSPNVGNYIVGKGVVTWTLQGTSTVIDLGNAQSFSVTPKVEKLPHWNQRGGIRFKDMAVALTKEMELMIQLDEWSYENLSLALFGSISGGGVINNILDLGGLEGQIVFSGSTNVGPQKIVTLPNCVLFPTGKIELISNEWAGFEVPGEVLGNSGSGSFGTVVDG